MRRFPIGVSTLSLRLFSFFSLSPAVPAPLLPVTLHRLSLPSGGYGHGKALGQEDLWPSLCFPRGSQSGQRNGICMKPKVVLIALYIYFSAFCDLYVSQSRCQSSDDKLVLHFIEILSVWCISLNVRYPSRAYILPTKIRVEHLEVEKVRSYFTTGSTNVLLIADT